MAFSPLPTLATPLFVNLKGGEYQQVDGALSFTIADWDNINNTLLYNDLSADVIGRAWINAEQGTGQVIGTLPAVSATGVPESFDYRITGEAAKDETSKKSFFVFFDAANATGNVVGVFDFSKVIGWSDKAPLRF